MKFTTWQIDRLRRSLNNYRLSMGRNARLLSWKVVLDRLLLCPATAHAYPKDGAEPEFKEEALRRFAGRTSTLQPDKLQDLKLFLIAEKFLREDELDDRPDTLRGLLVAQSYLASRTPEAGLSLDLTEGVYRATRESDPLRHDVRLAINREPAEWLVRVEEEVEIPIQQGRSDLHKRPFEKFAVRQIRSGYGFASTPLHLLHIFLTGESETIEVSYVQVEPTDLDRRGLHLLRSGIQVINVQQGRDVGSVLARNVFAFVDASA